jgi:hypothetical protein
MVRGLGGALLLGSVLSGDPVVRSVHADAARGSRAGQARGDHLVRATLGQKGAELLLKDGFSLRARARRDARPVELVLRVAEVRAQAAAIAPGFVPIGPSAAVAGDGVRADVAYRAEAFHVRQGHRLVLALERSRCGGDGCWALHSAVYEDSRCLARDVVLQGRRLQFGSVPDSRSSGSVPGRSAAP